MVLPGEAGPIGHRLDIQGLRALAIALVVLAHSGVPFLAGGIIGVDVFYVLSGYLITGLLLNEHTATGRIRVVDFYARRLKRLLPALLLMLVVTLLLAAWLLSPEELKDQARSAPFAATWTSNLFFALARMDYFAELQTRDLFLHTWSLGVEEQYYLAWPLLLLLAARGRAGAQRDRRLLIVLAALFAASAALFAYWTETRPLWAFYQMPSRGWQFALGAATFLAVSGQPRGASAWAPQVAGVAGLVLIAASAVILKPESAGYWLLAPSLGAALVLGAGAAPAISATVLRQAPLVWLGDRSYSWYLWHWPFLMLGAALGVKGPAGTACLVAGSLAVAAASYTRVELPCWKGPLARALPARRAIVAAAAGMLIALAGPVLFAHRVANTLPAGEAAVAAAARMDVPEIYAMGCDSWYQSTELNACLSGAEDAPRTVAMIGDSAGLQWFPLFRELFPEPQWRIVVLTKSACPMVDEDYFYPRIGAVYSVCREWRNAMLDALPQLKPQVIVVGSGHYPFTERQWVEGAARVLAYLKGVAPRVVVLAPTPALTFDGPGCLQRLAGRPSWLARLGTADCSEAMASPATALTIGYLRQAIERAGGVAMLDLGDRVCPDGICAARAPDGAIVFRDAQHLTAAFARAQLTTARDRLAALAADQ